MMRSARAAKTQREPLCFWPEQPEKEAQERVSLWGASGEKPAGKEGRGFCLNPQSSRLAVQHAREADPNTRNRGSGTKSGSR